MNVQPSIIHILSSEFDNIKSYSKMTHGRHLWWEHSAINMFLYKFSDKNVFVQIRASITFPGVHREEKDKVK